jgi:hypothetical protein
MAADLELRVQLARLLGEAAPPASDDELQALVEAHFGRLVEGLVAEAIASDDVSDKESAETFVAARLADLAGLLSTDQRSRLEAAIREKIEAW